MGMLLLALVGLAFLAGGGGDKPSSSTSLVRETIVEPPESNPQTADFLIELTGDGESWSWRVLGKLAGPALGQREELGKGDALDRQHALEEAYDVIDDHRGKLPSPLNRHGVRMAADCRNVTVQNLGVWMPWAAGIIDNQAEQLAAEDRLTGGELMRVVFARAFPECKSATPKIRGRAWDRVAQSVQKIVAKAKAGEFIDLHPLGHVLAARMVGMSPPKIDGAAFFHTTGKGTPYAVLIDKHPDGGYRWRVWPRTVDGDPQEQGFVAGTLAQASNAAKNYVDGLAT